MAAYVPPGKIAAHDKQVTELGTKITAAMKDAKSPEIQATLLLAKATILEIESRRLEPHRR